MTTARPASVPATRFTAVQGPDQYCAKWNPLAGTVADRSHSRRLRPPSAPTRLMVPAVARSLAWPVARVLAPVLVWSAAALAGPALAQSPAAPAAGPRHLATVTALAPDIRARLDAMYPQIESLYQDLHAHPELAFEETRTAAKLAAEMRALGFEVTEGVGRTGVVAMLKNGTGPTVLVRTDLDALPMEEKTDLPYASKAKGSFQGRETYIAHSCGHDLHMASWVASARTLVQLKDKWQGTLMFIGQPAEEIVSGARAMLDDGLYARFGKPDFVLGLHGSAAAVGSIGYNTGPVTSNSDSLDITFLGRGGHGSAPHKAVDPIAIASRFVVDVQTVVSREKDPMAFGVVTVGAFNAGTVGNIIPDRAVLRGTIRSYDAEVRQTLLDGVQRTARAAALVAGAPEPEVKLQAGGLAIINDVGLAERLDPVFRAAVGDARVGRVPPITASEDFSQFVVDAAVPGLFFFVGVSDPARLEEAAKPGGRPLPFNHSPYFAPVPEPSIKAGSAAMVGAVLELLATN